MEEPGAGEECRICFEAGGDLVSPCVCRGSQRFVHLACLEACARAQGRWTDLRCPSCHTGYKGRAAVHLCEVALAVHGTGDGPQNGAERASLEAVLLFNLANALNSAGDPQQARGLLERVVELEERVHGPEHIEVAVSLTTLAGTYDRLGKSREALDMLRRALPILERKFGAGSPRVAATLSSAAVAQNRLGNNATAALLLERTLRIEEAHFGPTSAHVASTLNSLAVAHTSLGRAEEALGLLQRALAIEEQHYGHDHAEVSVTLNNLAFAWGAQQHPDQALGLLDRALAIKRAMYGGTHAEVAPTILNAALMHAVLGDLAQAEACCEAGQGIINDPKALHYIPGCIKAAVVFSARGEAAEADALVQRSVDECERRGQTLLPVRDTLRLMQMLFAKHEVVSGWIAARLRALPLLPPQDDVAVAWNEPAKCAPAPPPPPAKPGRFTKLLSQGFNRVPAFLFGEGCRPAVNAAGPTVVS